MNVFRINLTGEEVIEAVAIEMSAREAAYLAKLLGKQKGTDSEQIMPGGAEINSEVYDCLSGLFNRFYENGVDEAVRDLR